jgi:hypothetical protein
MQKKETDFSQLVGLHIHQPLGWIIHKFLINK